MVVGGRRKEVVRRGRGKEPGDGITKKRQPDKHRKIIKINSNSSIPSVIPTLIPYLSAALCSSLADQRYAPGPFRPLCAPRPTATHDTCLGFGRLPSLVVTQAGALGLLDESDCPPNLVEFHNASQPRSIMNNHTPTLPGTVLRSRQLGI